MLYLFLMQIDSTKKYAPTFFFHAASIFKWQTDRICDRDKRFRQLFVSFRQKRREYFAIHRKTVRNTLFTQDVKDILDFHF